MAGLFYFISRLAEDGTMQMKNAVGRLGEVYMVIPKKGSGFGKVHINVQGALREMDAISNGNKEIPVGTVIKVLEVIDEHILLVTEKQVAWKEQILL